MKDKIVGILKEKDDDINNLINSFSSDKKYFRILASFSWSPSPAEESEVSSPEYHCIYTSVYPVYQIPVKVLVLICGGAAFFFLYRRHKKNHISQKDVP